MKRDFHIGPGAASLILIIVVLSMSVLSILALTSARSDERLSVRAANVATAVAELNNSAEKTLAELDALLLKASKETEDDAAYFSLIESQISGGKTFEDNCIAWIEKDEEGRLLNCSIEILPHGSEKRFVWKEHRLSSEFAEIELEDTWN